MNFPVIKQEFNSVLPSFTGARGVMRLGNDSARKWERLGANAPVLQPTAAINQARSFGKPLLSVGQPNWNRFDLLLLPVFLPDFTNFGLTGLPGVETKQSLSTSVLLDHNSVPERIIE